jgi:hypothetical protein
VKKRLQGFIAGILICSLILSIPVLAAGTTKTIKAVFNAVTVKLDGKAIGGDKISYNGNVYISTKSLATILGKTHTVDKSGNVTMATKGTTAATTSLPQSITQNKVTIKLNKAEQDSDSLRLYVTYINNSDDQVMTGDSLAKVVSSGKQYEYDSDYNFDRYYEKDNIYHAPYFIESGVAADSVIFFKPISNVNSINVVLSADFNDYRFNNIKVTVK